MDIPLDLFEIGNYYDRNVSENLLLVRFFQIMVHVTCFSPSTDWKRINILDPYKKSSTCLISKSGDFQNNSTSMEMSSIKEFGIKSSVFGIIIGNNLCHREEYCDARFTLYFILHTYLCSVNQQPEFHSQAGSRSIKFTTIFTALKMN